MEDLFVPLSEDEKKKIDKEYEKVKEEYNKKNKKKYYLLAVLNGNENEGNKVWEDFTGRDSIVDYIEEFVKDECLDVDNSLVLTDDVPIKEALTVYEFMKVMSAHYDHGFDIDDYI